MGLDTASIKFACAAKSLGVDFTKLLMIGRQSLFPDADSLQHVFSLLEIGMDAEEFLHKNRFGETFFSLLGAREIDSLDYSSYEGATIVHDMNSPIPDILHQRFSVVYDGGTLEHVFNVPQALKNCMEMIQVGGHFLQVNEANNFMGHGFWQFSPELLFRVFSPANGFEIKLVLLHEVVPGGAWYAVTDPDTVQQRVELCNRVPTYILTIATRVSDVKIFARPPLQSDYSAVWDRTSREQSGFSGDTKPKDPGSDRIDWSKRVRRGLPEPIKRVLRSVRKMARSIKRPRPFDRPYYRYIHEENLLRGTLD